MLDNLLLPFVDQANNSFLFLTYDFCTSADALLWIYLLPVTSNPAFPGNPLLNFAIILVLDNLLLPFVDQANNSFLFLTYVFCTSADAILWIYLLPVSSNPSLPGKSLLSIVYFQYCAR